MLSLDWTHLAPPTPARPARSAATLGAAAATAGAGWAVTATRLHTRTRQLHRAHRDPVTGLLTRAAWEPAAHHALRHEDSTLGLLDLNEFKPVNDSHGHEVGDHVLHAVGTRLTAQLGPAAVVCRLGGDEFAFVTCDLSPDRLDALLAALTTSIPITNVGALRIGVSLGISRIDRPAVLADALATADLAMYEAKARHGGWRLHTAQSGSVPHQDCLPAPADAAQISSPAGREAIAP